MNDFHHAVEMTMILKHLITCQDQCAAAQRNNMPRRAHAQMS